MKKIAIIIAAISSVALTGCLKDTPHTDFTKTGATAEILYSGMEYFSNSSPQGQSYAISFSQDTVSYDVIVNINSDYPLATDTKVTLAVNDALRTAYNATSTLQYLPMPSGVYRFPVTTGVVKAGTRQLHFSLLFITAAFDTLADPTLSYMLPITLTDASGLTIASNFATIYPHSIGNLISGNYTHEWIRYNSNDTTGVTPYADETNPDILAPIDGTTVSLYSGTGVDYIVTFTNGNVPGGKDLSLLSNFAVTFDPTSVTKAGITITGGPTIVADPVHHKYNFWFTYNNASGSPRIIYDNLTQ